MERVIGASLRGVVCVLTLAGLAACGQDGSSGNGTPSAQSTPQTHPSGIPVNPPAIDPPASPADANAAPEIAGSPAPQVVIGHNFSFTPTATDADGDTLRFSIAGKPSWAAFDEVSGRLSGTPSASDVGSHEDITIRVSDGHHERAMSGFTVNVVEQADGSATLTWHAPTQNTDGSPLSTLKGYRIHYGAASGEYDQTITLNNAGLSSYVVENLAPGTYFFAITAIAANGSESTLSSEVSETL